MGDTNKRRLIFSIVEFLNKELSNEDISEDAKEGLEVASQCLQTAYCLAPEDTHLAVSKPIDVIFNEATVNEPLKKKAPPTADEKEQAEKLKLEGNELMRAEKFEEAIEKYTKAIELDSSNQVFYCNRAAAYSKLEQHYAAVEDCQRALDMDPKYGKAYGRMGLAYSSIHKHKEAVDCFKKAIEIEPENESYQSNLKLAEDKLATAGSPGPAAVGFPPGGIGGLNLGSMLENPALMNMATTMMSDPNIQNMMGQLMSGGAAAQGGNSMDGLLMAGQRLAEQMQQSNPDLVDQLRRQMGGSGGGESEGSSGEQQPPSSEDSKKDE